MRKTWKTLFFTLIAAVLSISVLGLAACGGDDDATGDSGKTTTYTITFDVNGGNWTDGTVGNKTVTTGQDGTVNIPLDPERTGYTFDGWYTEKTGGTEVTALTVFTGDDTVYAHWTESKSAPYTITLNPNGGTWTDGTAGNKTDTTGVDGMLTSLPGAADLKKDGNTFDGWYTAATGGVAVFGNTVFENDDTIYAHWSPVLTINVTFKLNGGKWSDNTTEDKTLTANADGTLDNLPTPTREDYRFEGWNSQADGTGIRYTENSIFANGDVVYAVWKQVIYTVMFNPNGGTWTDGTAGNKTAKTGEDGKLTSMPGVADVTKGEDYRFDGWWTEPDGTGTPYSTADEFTADTTVYVKWTQIKFTITFDPNGGTWTDGTVGNKTAKTNENGSLAAVPTASEVKRDGYTFEGWWTDQTDGAQCYDGEWFNADKTIYAHWKLIPTPVTGIKLSKEWFLLQMGESALELDVIVMPSGATERGFKITNFDTDKIDVVGNTATGKVTIAPKAVGTAYFDVISSYVDPNSTVSISTSYSVTIVSADEIIVNLDPNGGVLDGGVDRIVTKVKTVTEQDVHYIATADFPKEPTRDGYTFVGWFTEATDGDHIYNDETRLFNVNNTTLYAHWKVQGEATASISAGNGADSVVGTPVCYYDIATLRQAIALWRDIPLCVVIR